MAGNRGEVGNDMQQRSQAGFKPGTLQFMVQPQAIRAPSVLNISMK